MELLKSTDIDFIERFLHAFKILGGDEHGLINYEFFKRMLQKNHGNDARDIVNLINSEKHVHNQKLDCISLCSSILYSKTVFNNVNVKNLENGTATFPSNNIDSRTFTRNKGSSISNIQSPDTSLSKNEFNKQLKGLLFNISGNLLSYRYQLDIQENCSVEITAKAISRNGENASKTPIEILIFQDGKTKVFVTSSSVTNSDGYCSINCTLKRGRYILVPILLKWDVIGKSNSFDSLNSESLLHLEGESEVVLTPACEEALDTVFHSIDLDENGLLSQVEFEFFIRHTSGETAAEEWTTIEDNFKIKDHQLTFEGFLELYKLVLKTDPSDVTNMLQQMGLNESLELENAQPFHIVVSSSSPKFSLSPLPVSSFKEVAEKILRKVAVENGVSSKVKNMNDLFFFIHRLPHRATIVVQNQSHCKVDVKLDCNQSLNCESHLGVLECSVEIPPRTSLIAHHLFPIDPNREWRVDCKESLK